MESPIWRKDHLRNDDVEMEIHKRGMRVDQREMLERITRLEEENKKLRNMACVANHPEWIEQFRFDNFEGPIDASFHDEETGNLWLFVFHPTQEDMSIYKFRLWSADASKFDYIHHKLQDISFRELMSSKHMVPYVLKRKDKRLCMIFTGNHHNFIFYYINTETGEGQRLWQTYFLNTQFPTTVRWFYEPENEMLYAGIETEGRLFSMDMKEKIKNWTPMVSPKKEDFTKPHPMRIMLRGEMIEVSRDMKKATQHQHQTISSGSDPSNEIVDPPNEFESRLDCCSNVLCDDMLFFCSVDQVLQRFYALDTKTWKCIQVRTYGKSPYRAHERITYFAHDRFLYALMTERNRSGMIVISVLSLDATLVRNQDVIQPQLFTKSVIRGFVKSHYLVSHDHKNTEEEDADSQQIRLYDIFHVCIEREYEHEISILCKWCIDHIKEIDQRRLLSMTKKCKNQSIIDLNYALEHAIND